MSFSKRDPAVRIPSLAPVEQQYKSRKPAIRLVLSARGPRKDHHANSNCDHRGAQTERQLEKEGSHIEAFYKTRYCRYFTQQGNCWKGSECQFAHSENELRTPPDLTKTRMCAMFRLGYCKLSAQECSFAHSLGDLKATDNFYKTEICSFWANGFCRAGDACRHAHGENELRPRLQLVTMKSRTVQEYKSSSSLASSNFLDPDEEEQVQEEEEPTTSPPARTPNTEKLSNSTSYPSVAPCHSSSDEECRNKMLASGSTSLTSTRSSTSASSALSRADSPLEQAEALECCEKSSDTKRRKSCQLRNVPKLIACQMSQSSSSVGAQTPESRFEDFASSSASSQTPKMTPAVFVPSPMPCLFPAPWMYMAIPPSRQFVGIPLDDALNDEGLDREGFCLGVPSYSSMLVTMGFMMGQATPPSYPSPSACGSWTYSTTPCNGSPVETSTSTYRVY